MTELTQKYIEALILKELHEVTGTRMEPVVRQLASAGIAQQPESVRRELMQLVAGLDLQNPEELEQLGKMVAQLMDASRENIEGDYGLEEDLVKKIVYEEIEAFLAARKAKK